MADEKKEAGPEGIEIWRCPQLGGPVTFGYCARMNSQLPCQRIIACWGGAIDVVAYLEGHFSHEELETALGGGKDRWTRIVEALEAAKQGERKR